MRRAQIPTWALLFGPGGLAKLLDGGLEVGLSFSEIGLGPAGEHVDVGVELKPEGFPEGWQLGGVLDVNDIVDCALSIL